MMKSSSGSVAIAPERLEPVYGIGFSNPERLRREAAGTFPRRVPISSRLCVYICAEVEAWLATQADQRDAAAAERSVQARKGVETREARRPAKAAEPAPPEAA